jgi:hypothetical protein
MWLLFVFSQKKMWLLFGGVTIHTLAYVTSTTN